MYAANTWPRWHAQVYAQYGESTYTSGMKVVTTLRAADQQAGWKAVRKTLIDRELRLPGAARKPKRICRPT